MHSVRPPNNSFHEVGGGLGVSVDVGRDDGIASRGCDAVVRPVFPMQETDGAADGAFEDMLCIPCEEEEQAEMPLCLPSVYQPTRSEYMDHCVTHYPFRAWCKHCLEGRGREFGHSHMDGAKDERSTPVVSFDYCFVSDAGDITTAADFEAAGEGARVHSFIRQAAAPQLFIMAANSW